MKLEALCARHACTWPLNQSSQIGDLSKAEGIMFKEKLKLDGRFQSIVSKFVAKYYN
jgi:hypothetical protein